MEETERVKSSPTHLFKRRGFDFFPLCKRGIEGDFTESI
jgi:hypothetical protein